VLEARRQSLADTLEVGLLGARGRLTLIVVNVLAMAAVLLPATTGEAVRTETGLIAPAADSPRNVRVFRGIPFAAPPVGPLRWLPPQPSAHWDGVRKGDAFGPVCVQPKGVGRLNVSVDLPGSPRADEDCLYLNVWSGAASAGERRPVMVWIFGGAYTEGAGSSPHNDGEALARKGAVVVTFNYRLGPFGFFSHPELTKTSHHHASGNQGVLDAIAALRWVQRNIAAFGGDPANVTIFGESAGAALSAGLVGSPLAKGLFRRAISESGAWMGLSIGPMRSRASAEAADGRGASPMPALKLDDLRAKSADEIGKGLRGAGMIVDGWAIPEDLSLTFNAGRQNAVDVLVGSNKDEGSFVLRGPTAEQWIGRTRARWGDLADAFLKLYPAGTDAEAAKSSETAFSDEMAWHMRLYAGAQAKLGRAAYLYYFTREPPVAPGQPNLRATHTAEIPYVFDNLEAARVYPDSSSPELASASEADRRLADIVSSYWVNFARTGNPNGNGLPEWPAYRNQATGRAMAIGLTQQIRNEDGTDAAKWELYDRLYAKQLTGK
jgi:para-nitrobenzyl esterase